MSGKAKKKKSLAGSSTSGFSVAEDIGTMTLLEKRMLEKKAGNFLTDADIRNIFNQFDRDSNGYLGAHDLAIVYRSLGENLEDDLIDELIREADKDGDGQIAYPEFYNLVKLLEHEGGGMRDPNAKAAPPVKRGKKESSSGSGSDSDRTSSSGSY
eukprot:CAMPEP_0179466076 /NCGR_PEP_ID=MMETSP0799-20121207/47493_1 /TAXON_ID=46947 /ORGANISM="Geminigera cryophila, Strain CCMP2564" /LENGTH=154 /DNA_ID=CAMNT_0021270699 /DNA_START=165 /DNA_END=629 /DNA_ORIENTATION=+